MSRCRQHRLLSGSFPPSKKSKHHPRKQLRVNLTRFPCRPFNSPAAAISRQSLNTPSRPHSCLLLPHTITQLYTHTHIHTHQSKRQRQLHLQPTPTFSPPSILHSNNGQATASDCSSACSVGRQQYVSSPDIPVYRIYRRILSANHSPTLH